VSVLATSDLAFDDRQWRRLREIFAPVMLNIADPADDAGMQSALGHAEIAILGGDVDARFRAAPLLRWIHVDRAGLDGSACPWVFERDLIVTGSAGRSAPALAEHAILFMLALATRLPSFIAAQAERRWHGVDLEGAIGGLYGRTLGIIGLGHTGRALAARAKPFGMSVLGYRRQVGDLPEHVDHLFCADRGDSVLPLLRKSDFVVLAIPLSDVTHRLIGAQELAQMKPHAVLINIGRGGVVDEAALAEALVSRKLGGAGLDVFAVEPLPVGSPLWEAPATLITPHFTFPLPSRGDRSLDIIAENLRRFRAGEGMLNRLELGDVLTFPN